MSDIPIPNTVPPLPHREDPLQRLKDGYQPIEGSVGILAVAETVLKRPGGILYELREGRYAAVMGWLLVLMAGCLLVYGFTAGLFSGGQQLWIAPVKVTTGMLFSGLICLPSLFIFGCLSGANISVRETTGMMVGMISITALLLLGFGPVSFVFSQSTESVAFMGFLQLLFWGIAVVYGLQFLHRAFAFMHGGRKGHLAMWTIIFLLVSLQMTTTLRPIIGSSETFFQTDKKFFVTHWFESFAEDVDEGNK